MKSCTRFGLLLLLCLGFATSLQAQLRFVPWSQNYVVLTSYLGVETQERFNTFKFELNGINVFYPNWSLSARLVAPIRITEGGPNRSGKVFPADKISLRWTTDNSDSQTNLNSMGANRNDIRLQNTGEVMLIDRSLTPLSSYGRHYTDITLFSALKVAQGKYLDDFLSGRDQYTHIKYSIPVLYTLYDENKNVLGTQQIDYMLHIHPNLTDGGLVDMEPDYSLLISTEASDATLSFRTAKDYRDGVSLAFPNAVKVNALTDYELTVKATETSFLRNGGGALPLSILSLQLTPGQAASGVMTNPKRVLSNNPQAVLTGRSTDKKVAQFFNLHYEAKLTPAQVASSTTGSYTVSLLYQLMPR